MSEIRNRITYLCTGKRRCFTMFITVVVLVGLYCIFADAPFAWLFGDVIIHDLEL